MYRDCALDTKTVRLDLLVDGHAGGLALADQAAQAANAVLHYLLYSPMNVNQPPTADAVVVIQ